VVLSFVAPEREPFLAAADGVPLLDPQRAIVVHPDEPDRSEVHHQ
jgi:hypothetical protein